MHTTSITTARVSLLLILLLLRLTLPEMRHCLHTPISLETGYPFMHAWYVFFAHSATVQLSHRSLSHSLIICIRGMGITSAISCSGFVDAVLYALVILRRIFLCALSIGCCIYLSPYPYTIWVHREGEQSARPVPFPFHFTLLANRFSHIGDYASQNWRSCLRFPFHMNRLYRV